MEAKRAKRLLTEAQAAQIGAAVVAFYAVPDAGQATSGTGEQGATAGDFDAKERHLSERYQRRFGGLKRLAEQEKGTYGH